MGRTRTKFGKHRKIVGFRNRLIHAYDAVDSAMVWAIVKKHLEPLRKEVENLIYK
jgi:uncharacterized protein with HEPN domain